MSEDSFAASIFDHSSKCFMHLGFHPTAKRAAIAYDDASIELGNQSAFMNWPRNANGYYGVSLCASGTAYAAQNVQGLQTLGVYATPTEAAIAFDSAILKDNNKNDLSLLNFPNTDSRKNEHHLSTTCNRYHITQHRSPRKRKLFVLSKSVMNAKKLAKKVTTVAVDGVSMH